MNKIINKFLLTGNKCLQELHLKQSGFTYNACGPFTKHRERISIFWNKDLCKRTISDHILKDGAYEITKNGGYDGYQRALASMVYKFFEKKTGSPASVNEKLPEELDKPVTKKFKRRKLYARFKVNIWAADLAEMESLSSKNKNVKYLLCVIDDFAKYAWVNPQVRQFLMLLWK